MRGHGNADRVGDENLICVRSDDSRQEVDDAAFVDRAFEWAVEGGRERDRDAAPILVGRIDDRHGVRETLLDRAARVALLERLARSERDMDFSQ